MRWIAAFSVALVLGLAIASTTRAAPDASSVRRKAVRAWRAREKAYLEGLGDRLTQVYQEWTAKRRLWASDPDAYKDEVVPLDGLRELFDAYVALQEEANERDRTFAACGDPKVLPTLFKDLLDLAKAIDATEAQIASSNPSGSGGRYPVEPVIRRHGQAARLRGLVEAIAAVPASSTFLAGPGLVKAAKGDRKRSTVRRSALLDCLGRIGDEPARAKLLAMLEAPQPSLRIVGLENLCGLGAGVVERLSPRLADPSPAVRRALLDAVRERAADVPAWIPVLVPALEGVRGTERVRLIRALEALTGEPLGDRPPAWIQWLEGHRTAIEDGSFVRLPPPEEKESAKGKEGENGKKDRGGEAKAPGARDGAEEGEAKPKPAAGPPVPPAITFYGVPSPS
ncbi:MAG: HEAT repeat domain-containing protein, partial [Planctomycetota bacterium]